MGPTSIHCSPFSNGIFVSVSIFFCLTVKRDHICLSSEGPLFPRISLPYIQRDTQKKTELFFKSNLFLNFDYKTTLSIFQNTFLINLYISRTGASTVRNYFL